MRYEKIDIKACLLKEVSYDILKEHDQDYGQLETINATTEKLQEFSLNLIRALIKKKVLTLDEAIDLIYDSQR